MPLTFAILSGNKTSLEGCTNTKGLCQVLRRRSKVRIEMIRLFGMKIKEEKFLNCQKDECADGINVDGERRHWFTESGLHHKTIS